MVNAKTNAKYYIVPDRPGVSQNVHIETEIMPDKFGGFGFQHTGTVSGGATLIKDLKVVWK